MPDNIDEDLIEATIRRVAEASAARQDELQGQPLNAPEPEPVAADEPGDADEDLIEATIRRVQAQKAAAEAAEPQEVAQGADSGGDELQPDDAPPLAAAGPDEDAIAATILRVQQQAAAREAALDDDDAPSLPNVPAGDGALTAVERQLDEARDAIARLTGRVEALERLALQSASAEVASSQRAESHAPVSINTPQRNSILRDVSAPRTALAEQLPEPGVIDTRPLPKPLPPIHAESKRGLDLLPRTYRITVEDKRRGVDLVPLHRALLSMDGVKDMSLLSYNNGVAIVALETTNDLDADDLGSVVSRAMSRGAKVERHNENTFVVKLADD